jgi:hypothetical protein
MIRSEIARGKLVTERQTSRQHVAELSELQSEYKWVDVDRKMVEDALCLAGVN